MDIAVIGAGAIGCLFGIRLSGSGHEVLFVHHRKGVVDSINRRGVRLREINGSVVRTRARAVQSLEKSDKAELILVTVKAYDTASVSACLKPAMGSATTVLSLQNGLGNLEVLSSNIPPASILGGSTAEAAFSAGPGSVIHTGRGKTWIGELNGRPSGRSRNIKDDFQHAGFETGVSTNIRRVLWTKAIVNSFINPVSALTRLPNGELSSLPGMEHLARLVLREGMVVARRQGVPVLKPSPTQLLPSVLSTTAQNRSSMLQDIDKGGKTEILQLNGAISKIGQRHAITTPHNDLLTMLVLGLERSQIPKNLRRQPARRSSPQPTASRKHRRKPESSLHS